MNASAKTSASSTSSKDSAFRKPSYKRSVAILSTSGIVFGFGLSGSSQAFASTPAECIPDRIVTPAMSGLVQDEVQNVLNIYNQLDQFGVVCLRGNFILDQQVFFDRHVTVYGLGPSSISSPSGTVFQSDSVGSAFFDIEIIDLSIIDSMGTAVLGHNVSIVGSIISRNKNIGGGGAIISHGDVTISNSTLSANEATYGAAIYSVNAGDVTISNSTLSNNSTDSDGGAIFSADGGAVTITNSTLSNNSADTRGGAIYVSLGGAVTVSNSTLSDNSADTHGGAIHVIYGDGVVISNSTLSYNSADTLGGAIYGYGSVLTATNSTFLKNSALHGGAMYSEYDAEGGTVEISNSTFVENDAVGSGSYGGAIYAYDGEVFFSTFVNNTASTPTDEPGDTPGNSIYKTGTGVFEIGANIFAGDLPYPQLGIGTSPTPFTDLGGNTFTTSSIQETDIVEAPIEYPDNLAKDISTLFGKSLSSIFGTSTPSLASYAPNSNGPKTLALVVGSPALNAVPNRAPFNTFTLDQRGATRSFPASAGAFEGVAPVSPSPTPTTAPAALAKTGSENPAWVTIAAGSMIALGSLVTAVTSRLRRRSK